MFKVIDCGFNCRHPTEDDIFGDSCLSRVSLCSGPWNLKGLHFKSPDCKKNQRCFIRLVKKEVDEDASKTDYDYDYEYDNA
ncbi:uncharacterized protein Dana_GF26839, isoform B [Drosophila ananassae]|uniref:Uncharacterized protein, isoform B n=1 Tax=Drosophila ananassae TaxID=7217 RepID=A0A0P8ZEV0_DROAN|nr:uncharacterized protein Dana_GF26839, isoform B [Drosophila ananassae]